MPAHRTHYGLTYSGYLIYAIPRPAPDGGFLAGFDINQTNNADPKHPKMICQAHGADWEPLATEEEAVEHAYREARAWIDGLVNNQ
jgi:ABC-type oligopeptide transport system ATPase subunit